MPWEIWPWLFRVLQLCGSQAVGLGSQGGCAGGSWILGYKLPVPKPKKGAGELQLLHPSVSCQLGKP